MAEFTDITKKFENYIIYISSFDPTDQDGYKALGMEYNIYLFNKYRRDDTFLNDKLKNVDENIKKSKTRLASKFFIFYSSKPTPSPTFKKTEDAKKQTDGYFPVEEEQELFAAAKILKKIAPEAYLVVGSRQIGSIITLDRISNVQTIYKKIYKDEDPTLKILSIYQAAYMIKKKLRKYKDKKIFMDFFGCIGYFPYLCHLVTEDLLVKALKDTIIPIMGGVFPEMPQTMPIKGRNPYATMNQLYDVTATKDFMEFVIKHKIKLFYVTNNITKSTKFNDADIMIDSEKLGNSIYAQLSKAWYQPHLKDNYVDFDVFAFAVYCLYLVNAKDENFKNGFLFIDPANYAVQIVNDTNNKEDMSDRLDTNYANSRDANAKEKYDSAMKTIKEATFMKDIIFVNKVPEWKHIVPTLLFTLFPKD